MAAAYTPYKFKKMFGLVLFLFFILITIYFTSEAEQEVITQTASIDESGQASTLVDTYNNIPNPEAKVKQSIGKKLFVLMDETPEAFLVIVLLVTVILFSCGVYLKDLRGFIKRL